MKRGLGARRGLQENRLLTNKILLHDWVGEIFFLTFQPWGRLCASPYKRLTLPPLVGHGCAKKVFLVKKLTTTPGLKNKPFFGGDKVYRGVRNQRLVFTSGIPGIFPIQNSRKIFEIFLQKNPSEWKILGSLAYSKYMEITFIENFRNIRNKIWSSPLPLSLP